LLSIFASEYVKWDTFSGVDKTKFLFQSNMQAAYCLNIVKLYNLIFGRLDSFVLML